MKKITAIVMAAMLTMILGASTVFAAASGGFALEADKCNPKEGSKSVDVTNVMVKLYFNESIASEASQAANSSMFRFTDSEGNKVDYEIYYNSKDDKNVNLLAKKDLTAETDYTVTVSGAFTDDKGDSLGKDQTINFTTKKPASGGTYMLLMLAMIVVMIVMTVRDQRKSEGAEEVRSKAAAMQTNPYKLAKEKGISVEEATKLIAAEKAKMAKKVEKAEKNAPKHEPAEKKSKKPEKTVYKVKTKRIVKKH